MFCYDYRTVKKPNAQTEVSKTQTCCELGLGFTYSKLPPVSQNGMSTTCIICVRLPKYEQRQTSFRWEVCNN